MPGLADFLEQARKLQIPMAIGSAAIPFNINFVLDNLNLHHYFKYVVSADDVSVSKPDPETFLKLSTKLGLRPNECLVFEDTPKGVETAQNAGMDTVVLTTTHEPDEFNYLPNILHFAKNYEDPFFQSLLQS